MIDSIKSFLVKFFAGLNILVILLMLAVGFVGYLNPAKVSAVAWAGMVFPIFLVVNMTFLVVWLFFKWQMVFIPVAGFLLAYVPISIYIPLNMPSDVPDGAMKVLSYNVLGYHDKDGASSFDTIYSYLKASEATIVCLQEDNSLGNSLRKKMKKLYPHHDTHQVGGAPYFNSMGIYSRFPILRKQQIDYKSVGNGSVAYFLDVDGDTVVVINNHFESNDLTANDKRKYTDMLKGNVEKEAAAAESKKLLAKLSSASKKRAPQADAVHEFIEEHSRYPIIVCGDFNDNPLSYTRRVVCKGLTDCFVKSGRGLGLTYNQKGFNVRIDNILCSDHFEPYNCTVDSEIKASDHYPVYCWMKIRQN